MNPQDAIDFSREALKTCMLVGGPILVASLLIGLLVGLFQAMTQVQDQTVSFVPKILLLIVMIGLCLPWLTNQMLDFAKQSFETPMTQWAGNSRQRLFANQSPSPTNQDSKQSESLTPNQHDVLPANPLSFDLIKHPVADKPVLELPTQEINADPATEDEPRFKSPFLLPHYRTSKAPRSEIGG